MSPAARRSRRRASSRETPATGEVTFSNSIRASRNAIPGGRSCKTETNIEFRTLGRVTLPPAKTAIVDGKFVVIPSTRKVGVEAVKPGLSGNVGRGQDRDRPEGENPQRTLVNNRCRDDRRHACREPGRPAVGSRCGDPRPRATRSPPPSTTRWRPPPRASRPGRRCSPRRRRSGHRRRPSIPRPCSNPQADHLRSRPHRDGDGRSASIRARSRPSPTPGSGARLTRVPARRRLDQDRRRHADRGTARPSRSRSRSRPPQTRDIDQARAAGANPRRSACRRPGRSSPSSGR